MSTSRELASGEREIMRLLLEADFPGSDALAQQAKTVRAHAIDADGSLKLTVSGKCDRASVVRRIPVEAELEDNDDVTIHLLLHVVDGYLDELEVYRDDAARVQRTLAAPDLRVVVL